MTTNETPYSQAKPPKTITRIKSDRFLDITNLHTWVLFAALAACMYFFRQLSDSVLVILTSSRIPTSEKLITDAYMDISMYVVLIFVVVYFWFKYFRTDDLVDYQKDRLIFFIQDLRGKHVINTMAESMEELLKLISIVGIHSSTDGKRNSAIPKGVIIEYAPKISLILKIKIFLRLEKKRYSEYGVLIETFPPRLSDEFREFHEMALQKVVNGLPVNTLYENISCSVMEPKKQVLEYLLSLMNESKGDASDQHLADMYLEISKDNELVIKWRYYSFISLGERKNVEAARVQYGAIIPGLISSMNAASLRPVILRDSLAVIEAYQIMLGEVDA
ncbi:MAG: hypothetical protein PHZ06_11870 [Proteiniphilum sp.]|nr:hypothetical protein [Proteiniphilum sp.]